jgi:hypothetical protein
MKKQSINTIARKLFAGILTAAVLFLASTNNTKANAIKDSTVIAGKTVNANVEFVGSNELNYYFRVKFENATGELVQIYVIDENGEYLDKIVTKDKQFNKVFQLGKDLDVSKVSFIIKSNNTESKQSFSVNISTRMLEDVVVSKN